MLATGVAYSGLVSRWPGLPGLLSALAKAVAVTWLLPEADALPLPAAPPAADLFRRRAR